MDTLCRSCMRDCTERKNLFEVKTASSDQSYLIVDMFTACASVEITKTDPLPKIICTQCELKLSVAFEFKQQCEETDNCLRKLVSENIDEEIEIKPDINDYYDDTVDRCVSDSEDSSICKNDKATFHCRFCLKRFRSQNSLELHSQKHSNERLQSSRIRQQKFSKSNAHKHFQSVHETEVKCTTYTCEECNISFMQAYLLSRHMKEHESQVFVKSKNREDSGIDVSKYLKDECVDIDIQDCEDKDRHECTCCNKAFTTFAGLKVHMRQHTSYNLHPCVVCKKNFIKSSYLKHHMLTHGVTLEVKKSPERNKKDRKVMQCEFCDRLFKNEKSFNLHMRTEHGISDDDSDVPLSTLIEKKNEINEEKKEEEKTPVQMAEECIDGPTNDIAANIDWIPDDEFPTVAKSPRCYTCHVCQATFSHCNYLRRHMTLHSAILIHKCGKCDKAFATPEYLAKHSEKEHIDKPYACTICDKTYSRGELLIRHLKTHLNPTEIDIKCSMCEQAFSSSDQLARHIKLHLQQDKRYVCGECGKAFNRPDNLKSHQKVHTGQKSNSKLHLCIYCGKEFSNSSNMIVHMRIHTGEKPYKCGECGKGFPRSHDLKSHERTHSGEKPYKCTLCGKAFNRNNKLLRHTRVHTGERPYACNLCSRAFTQSNDLVLHMRRHTGARPYACGMCPAKFIQSTQLKTHRRSTGHWMETETDLKEGHRVEPVVPPNEPVPIKLKTPKRRAVEELSKQPHDTQSASDVANSFPEKVDIEKLKLINPYRQPSDMVTSNVNKETHIDKLSDRIKCEV